MRLYSLAIICLLSCNSFNESNNKKHYTLTTGDYQNHLIKGTWVVDSADYLPAMVIYNEFGKGGRFVFKAEQELNIYNSDTSSTFQTYGYKLYDSVLLLTEGDMGLNLKVVKRTADTLVFRSRKLNSENPKWQYVFWKIQDKGYKIYLKRVKSS